MKYRKKIKYDIFLTMCLLSLFTISCLMVYSATAIGNKYGMFTAGNIVPSTYFLIRQIIWVTLAILAYYVFYRYGKFSDSVLKNPSFHMFGAIFIGIMLFIPRLLGQSVNGAYSWINIAGFTFQPSILAQIYIIVYLSFRLNVYKVSLMSNTNTIKKHLVDIFLIPLTLIGAVFLQNDTGTVLVTLAVVVIIFLCSNASYINIVYFIRMLFASSVILILIYVITGRGSHIIDRFTAFLNPFSQNTAASEHIVNSMIAFSNGGLVGRGPNNSIQKLGYLPEAHTDFILAVTAEEFGLVGILIIVSLLSTIILKVLSVGIKSNDSFKGLFAIGFATLLLVQTIVNIGGVTGSIPMTGVPIPFYSYGGSSILILSATLGLVMNMKNRRVA